MRMIGSISYMSIHINHDIRTAKLFAKNATSRIFVNNIFLLGIELQKKWIKRHNLVISAILGYSILRKLDFPFLIQVFDIKTIIKLLSQDFYICVRIWNPMRL